MRMSKSTPMFLALALASMTAFDASAQIAQKTKSLEKDGVTYTLYLDDKTAMFTLYSETSATKDQFDIPEEVEDAGEKYAVTVIGSASFSLSNGAKRIKIPKSVVKIEDNAFYPMSEAMIIEEFEVDAENSAYKSEGGMLLDKSGSVLLQVPTRKSGELNVPATVTAIGWGAVAACRDLTQVKIPEGVTSIGAYAFQFCSKLSSVELPSTLVSLGDYAFNNCNSLASVTARMLHPFRLTGQNAKDLTSKIVYIPKCYTSEYSTYWGTSNTYTVRQTQATAENTVITLAVSSYTYDGTERQPAVSLSVDGHAVAAEEYKVVYANNKAAGTATVTISDALPGCGNFEIVEKPQEFKIEPREATVEWGTTAFTYDGAPKAARATVKGLIEGDTCSVAAYDGQHRETNAGTYKATVKSLTNSNYKLPANAETQWTIGRKNATPTLAIADYDKTFDGKEKRPAVTLRDGDAQIPQSEYEVSYADNVKAGTAKLTVKSATGGNYDFAELSQAFEVAKRVLAPAWAQTRFVFDGAPKTVTATLSNVVVGHPCSPTAYEGASATDAGTYNATVTAISDHDNYQLAANASTEWVIAPRSLSTGEFSIVVEQGELLYNGAPHSPAVSLQFGDLAVPPAEYNVEYRGNTHAGTATVVVKNQDGGNYTLAEKTATFQIGPRPLTLSSASQSWTYDGEPHSAPTVEVADATPLVATDALAYAGFPSVTNVGQVSNVFTVAAVPGTDTRIADYAITVESGTLVVSKAAQVAPAVSGRGTSSPGADDGQFVGATTLMEFRRQDDAGYVPVTNPSVPLAAGVYYIRFAETPNLLPSPDTEVQIALGGKLMRSIDDYSVTLPSNTNFDGQAKVATVRGPGAITVLYSADNAKEWTSDAPSNVGHYEVMFTVAEDEGHHAASFTSPRWVFDVVHDAPAADFVPASGGYCAGTEGAVAFRIAAGVPTEYRAVVAAGAESLARAEYAPLDGSGSLSFAVPGVGEGRATLWVQFRDVFGFESEVYSVEISVNLSSDYITDIWSDVVSVVNKVDLDDPANLTPRFVSYQWYRNGEPISMATKPYYQQPGGLVGSYHARVVTTSGETLTICPKTWGPGSVKALSLRVFPNPVTAAVNVALSDDDGGGHSLTVLDNKGVVVGRQSFTGAEAQFDMSALNPGLYIVVVDGLKANVVKK